MRSAHESERGTPQKAARHGDDQGGLPYNRSSPWKAAVGMAFDGGL